MAMYDLRATFTKGEVTPLVHAREDLQIYKTSVAKLRNFMVLKQGGVRRRSGTRYFGKTKGTGTTELILFSFNDSQSYALEFGANYIRFWNDQGQILTGVGGAPVEVATPYTADQVSRLQVAQANDVLYIACPDVKPKQLNRLSDTNWTLTDVAFQDGPYLAVNDTTNKVNYALGAYPTIGASITLTHANTLGINGGQGFVSTDVGRLYRWQSLGVWTWGVITSVTNTTTIVVQIKGDAFLSPSAAATWVLVTGMGYVEAAGNTVQEIGQDGSGTLVGHLLTSADVGKVFIARGLHATPSGFTTNWWVRLTKIVDGATLEFVMLAGQDTAATNSATFQLGAFSDTTGYPGSVAFSQGRLCWGRTKANPRGVGLSVSGVPTVYSPTERDGTVTDDGGMFIDVTAGKSDEFHWIVDAARLLLGSPSSLRSVGASDSNQELSPKNVSAKLEIPTGSTPVVPVQVGPNTFTTKRFGQGIIDLAYQYEAGGIVSPEESILSEHLFHSGIRRMTYTESPEGVVWSLCNDGTLVAMTYDRYEQVQGFSAHDTLNGTIQSILSVPSTALGRDVLFMVVKRVIDGATVQYVEILEKPFYSDEKKNAFFVDCGATYSGSETSTVTGITWLEGQTVDLFVDGAVLPSVQVVGGAITLPNGVKGSLITFGLKITSEVTLLPLAVATQEGNQRGRPKRIVHAILDLLETRGGKIGIVGGILEAIMHRSPSDPMGEGPALFTGTTGKIAFDDTHDGDHQLTVFCDLPLPFTMRAVNLGIEAAP